MDKTYLKVYQSPEFENPRMIMGFSGWMNGGDVSTGTVEYLIKHFRARRFAHIVPDDFYIYNFPGSMEISALFRPYVELKEGIVCEYEEPSNLFYYDQRHQLIFFVGKEPNLKWKEFSQCVFGLAKEFNVSQIYYVGSFAGLVPHTREPRITASVSREKLKVSLEQCNIQFSNYQGPGSIITYFTQIAARKDIDMINLIAEIPPYVQGNNPRCIEALLKRLAKLLTLDLNLDELRFISDALETKLDTIIEGRTELAEHIKKLEENYDQNVFDTNMTDLKAWLEKQGIRLD